MPDQTLLSAEQIAEIKSGIRPLYSDLHNALCDTALSAIALREQLTAAEPFELLAEQFEHQRDEARSKLEWWASACQSQQTRAETAERALDTEQAVTRRLTAELSKLRAPVARYQYLRDQDWNTNGLCVVVRPKDCVKLGTDCPSRDRLDAAIDAAIRAREV